MQKKLRVFRRICGLENDGTTRLGLNRRVLSPPSPSLRPQPSPTSAVVRILIEFLVHPAEVCAGVEKCGHADSTWSCVKTLQTGRSACPPVCCITRSASEATSTRAPSTTIGQVIFTVHQEPETYRCSSCGSSSGYLSGRSRSLPQVPAHWQSSNVRHLRIPRVECRACGLVRQVDVSFADPRRSYTKAFERYALELSRSMTIRDVAHHLNVGWDLIKDIQKRDCRGVMPSPSSSICSTSPSTRSLLPRDTAI